MSEQWILCPVCGNKTRLKIPGGSEAGNWWLPRGIIFTWECDRLFRAVGSRKDVIKMGQPCGRKTAGL